MREDGDRASAFRAGIVLTIALMLGITYFVPALTMAGTIGNEPEGWVEGDFVISFDEPGPMNALHPVVATTPTNEITLSKGWDASIHAVWDEVDDSTGDWEIHYSKTSKDMPGYPLEWTGDKDDRVISETRKGKAPTMGNAVEPSIAVDSQGTIHVVWAQEYIEQGNFWEIHYAQSKDNGDHWSSEVGEIPGQDIPVSRYYGSRQDAEQIPGGPSIAVSYDNTIQKAPEILQCVWVEYTEKDGQEIYHSRSLNGGMDWTGVEVNVPVSNPGTPEPTWNPCITTTGEFGEFVHVAWSQMTSGKAPSEEIFYAMSDDGGGSWQGEEQVISDPGIPGIIDSVSMASGKDDVHIAWAQEDPNPLSRAPATGIFYNGDFGAGWEIKEAQIDYYDDSVPEDVSIAVTRYTGKAPIEVHVVWSERDDKSPKGTWEVHNSYSDVPVEPQSWTGLNEDIVLSWPDPEFPEANVHNVSAAMCYWEWENKWWPTIVWDEWNATNTKSNGKGNQNTEIFFDPPESAPIEYTLTTSVVGSGSISKNPDLPTYPDGTPVLLTANPSAGWSFDHWSGDLGGSTNPDTIIMDSDKSVTAHFVHIDLVANSVSGPASCTEGDSIDITRSYSNSGTQDSGSFRYGLYLSTNSVISTGDTLIYSIQIPNMIAGTTSTFTVNVGLPMGLTGTYYYGLIVDYLGQVTESNEGNNAVASASTVTIDPKVFTLTLISSPGAGGSISASPPGPYYYMDTVTLTAIPNTGWMFDHWEDDLTGSTNPDSIVMDADKTVTAAFTQNQYTLTITYVGSGSVSKNPDLPTYTYGTPVQLTAFPSVGWSFDHWSGDLGGSTNPDTIIMDDNKLVTAHFTEDQYTLTVNVVGSGSVTKIPNLPTYTYGQTVQLTANPLPGWSFDHWSGDMSGSTNPDTITIYGDSFVTAHFTQDQYTLTLTYIGSGSVVKNPDQPTYTYGTPVQLTAYPNAGWSFDHWSGDLTGSTNPDTIFIYGDSVVTAHFTEDQYTLTVNVAGSGSVIKSPDQPTYTYGTPVLLTANPSAGWSFDHWSGDMSGATNPDTIIIYGDSFVTAHFTQDQYTLTVNIIGSGSVVKLPDQPTYTYGTIVQLTANPDVGWDFDHWSGDMSGSSNPDTITIYDDSTVNAHFIEEQYTLTVTIVGSGSVIKNPDQPTYAYGTNVQLIANPGVGWQFDHWSGDLTGSTNPDSVTIYVDTFVTAHFVEITFDVPLTAGWNLVSVPLIQTNTALTTVLASISGQYDIVQYYDVLDTTDHWKTYATFKPPILNDLNTLTNKMGFWIHATSPCVLTAYGPIPSGTWIPLYAGSNMVGYPTLDTSTTVAAALAGTGYDKVEVCDLGEPYNLIEVPDTYVMQPGEGYLIHVPADTLWTVNW
jgi:hypothetical protein